jgi:hypothetical protein
MDLITSFSQGMRKENGDIVAREAYIEIGDKSFGSLGDMIPNGLE